MYIYAVKRVLFIYLTMHQNAFVSHGSSRTWTLQCSIDYLAGSVWLHWGGAGKRNSEGWRNATVGQRWKKERYTYNIAYENPDKSQNTDCSIANRGDAREEECHILPNAVSIHSTRSSCVTTTRIGLRYSHQGCSLGLETSFWTSRYRLGLDIIRLVYIELQSSNL